MENLRIATDVPLKRYSTMRLGGMADFATSVHTADQAAYAFRWADSRRIDHLVVGSGSNIVWKDAGLSGLLIVNRISGFELHDQDDGSTLLTAGAGENWDRVVSRSVEAGLSGIEALSLIPGTAGATPVQNVGAYGQDVSQTIVSVQAFDTTTERHVSIPADECQFGYRSSRFKNQDRGRFIITSVTFRLNRTPLALPPYRALQTYMDEHDITDTSPATIRECVIAIRSSKLPDPALIANNGSFFANPVVPKIQYDALAARYPNMPSWPAGKPDDRTAAMKLSAAWLLDTAGFKDYHDPSTGMATWHLQPLVLINESASDTSALLRFRDNIVGRVRDMFDISLEQEPELLPRET